MKAKFGPAWVLCLLAAGGAPGDVEVRLERPSGEYARWEMTLPGAFDPGGLKIKGISGSGDVRLYVWTRGERAVQAAAVSPADAFRFSRGFDLSALKAEGERLSGKARFSAHCEAAFKADWPDVWWSVEIDARSEDGRLGGRYSGTCALASARVDKERHVAEIERELGAAREEAARPVSGEISGRRDAGEAYRDREALAPGMDWPRWHGPDGGMRGPGRGHSLDPDLGRARLAWRCEQDLLPGKGQVTRYGGFGIYYRKPSGGGSSPVLAGSRLYLYYYVPSGEPYLKEEEEKRGPKGYFLKDMWRTVADDVVLCADAATGATLWKCTFPEAGRTFLTGKSNLVNNTVAVDEGMVVAVGGTGRVYALDAADGTLRWTATLPLHERSEQEKRAGKPAAGRAFPHAVTIAGGTAAVADEASGLAGFSLKDGREVWRIKNCLGRFATPAVWRHGDRAWFLALSQEGVLRAVSAADGAESWSVAGLGAVKWGQHSPFLLGDVLLVNATPDEEARKAAEAAGAGADAKDAERYYRQVAAFRLGPAGAERLWTLPVPAFSWPEKGGNGCFVKIDDRHVAYAASRAPSEGRPYFAVIEIGTGKVLQALEGGEGVAVWSQATMVACDDLILALRDNWHCETDFTVLVRGPGGWEPRGLFRYPHWPATSYEVPMIHPLVDGRHFVRGAEGIYCYDLRQREPPEGKPGP